jgi:hypothetical protein
MVSQASEIVESFREDIVAFHAAIGGRLVSLHTLLNTIGNSRSSSRFPLRLPITGTTSLATCPACRHRCSTLPASGDVSLSKSPEQPSPTTSLLCLLPRLPSSSS